MAEKCPICGEMTLETRRGDYTFNTPANIPGGPIVIEKADWDECTSCGEQILSLELEKALETERYKRLGLLTPEEIFQIRKRTGLSQVEISQILDVGEKTYARWESGQSLHNKSSDNLIRFFAQDAGLFERAEAERRPNQTERVKQYIEKLPETKGQNEFAIAAHGDELNSEQKIVIHRRLNEIMKSRGKGKV